MDVLSTVNRIKCYENDWIPTAVDSGGETAAHVVYCVVSVSSDWFRVIEWVLWEVCVMLKTLVWKSVCVHKTFSFILLYCCIGEQMQCSSAAFSVIISPSYSKHEWFSLFYGGGKEMLLTFCRVHSNCLTSKEVLFYPFRSLTFKIHLRCMEKCHWDSVKHLISHLTEDI